VKDTKCEDKELDIQAHKQRIKFIFLQNEFSRCESGKTKGFPHGNLAGNYQAVMQGSGQAVKVCITAVLQC